MSLKKLAISVAILALPAAAHAADIAPAPAYDWSGFYLGANAGYGWSNSDMNLKGLGGSAWDPYYPNALGSKDLSAEGFVGGLQAGYNMQFDMFVVGLETDFRYSDINDDSNDSGTANGQAFTYKQNYELNWFGTTRLRAGFALDRALIYGTGGVAYGDVDVGNKLDFPVTHYDASSEDWVAGWTVGGGIEYAVTDAISIKGEYLYYDLADTDVVANSNPVNASFKTKLTADNNGQIVSVGVNWHLQ